MVNIGLWCIIATICFFAGTYILVMNDGAFKTTKIVTPFVFNCLLFVFVAATIFLWAKVYNNGAYVVQDETPIYVTEDMFSALPSELTAIYDDGTSKTFKIKDEKVEILAADDGGSRIEVWRVRKCWRWFVDIADSVVIRKYQ